MSAFSQVYKTYTFSEPSPFNKYFSKTITIRLKVYGNQHIWSHISIKPSPESLCFVHL